MLYNKEKHKGGAVPCRNTACCALTSSCTAARSCPPGSPVLCDVTLTDAAGAARILPYPDRDLTRLGIDEGDTVCLLPDGTLHKL